MKYGPPRPRSRGKLGYPAAAGVLALSAAGFVGAAAFPAAAAENLCGTVDLGPTGNGAWNVQNNNYSETGEQCVTPTADGFTIDKAAGQIAAGGAPKSYPSLVAGCHWGRCTDTPGLPVKAADIGAARTGVDITPVKDGSWNAAYDLWFDKNKDAQGQNEGTELMVWVNGNEAPDPIGKVVGAVDIAGASWTVWQGNIGWDVISFIRDTPATSVDLPLKPFVDQAIERGATEPGDWLTSVQVGFEPWRGGQGLAMENFTLDLDGAGAAKDEKAPAQEPAEGATDAQDEPAQPAPAKTNDQDDADAQAQEQRDALAPTRAPAAQEPKEAPATGEVKDSADAAPQEATSAPSEPSKPSKPSTPEPSASEKAPEAKEQQAPAPQPAAPTTEADDQAPAEPPVAKTSPTAQAEKTPQPVKQEEGDAQQADDGDRLVLEAPQDTPQREGESAQNGDNARAQYREVDVDGRDAAWSLGWGTHSISGTAQVTNLPEGDQVTIAALHDDTRDRLSIATQEIKGKTALVMKVNGTSKGLPTLEANYQAGQAFDFELEIVDGAPRVHLDGDLVYQGKPGDIKDSNQNYWKAGPNNQANQDGDAQDQYPEVELSDLSITHESASAAAERDEQAQAKTAAKDRDTREARTPQQTRPTTTPSTKAKQTTGDSTLTSGATPKLKRPDDGYDQVAAGDDPALLIAEPAQGKDDGDGKSAGSSGGQMVDLADPDRQVTVHGDVGTTTTPDGSAAAVLNGKGDYLEVADSPDLSIATTGQLTVEMLIRPDVVEGLPDAEASSDGPMVQPLVKGSTFGQKGDQEYAMRLYDQDSDRPSRTSAYAFDPAGGQGAGSYAQDDLEAGQWVHLAAVYDTKAKGADGWGTVTLYRDGVKTDADSLGGDYEITPADGDSPLFIGGDGASSAFTGAIGAVAIYPSDLSAKQIKAHADAALTPQDDQGKNAGKSKGEVDAGKDEQGKDDGQQQDEPTTGARLIPIPNEKAGATS